MVSRRKNITQDDVVINDTGKNHSTKNCHDAFFKKVMSSPDNAREFLERHLPAEQIALCDLSTLKLQKDSFIDDDLKNYCCDLLWSVCTKDHGEGYIYWLLEHQSTADPLMAFRMMHYVMGVIYRHVKIPKKGRKNRRRPLPLVIPVLFYTGKRNPYPYSMSWFDLFAHPQMAAKIYGNPFALVNVTEIPDSAISQYQGLALMVYLFKMVATSRSLEDATKQLAELIAAGKKQGYMHNEDIITAMIYAIQAGKIEDQYQFAEQIAEKLPEEEEEIMGIAMTTEQWGRKKGRDEGRQEGRQEGKQEVARNLLKMGFSFDEIQQATQLSGDEIKALRL